MQRQQGSVESSGPKYSNGSTATPNASGFGTRNNPTVDTVGSPGPKVPTVHGAGSPAKPPKLLDRLRETLRRRHYSIHTEEAYANWCRRFILFHNKRHPAEMGEAEIRDFLTHLAVDGRVAASTQNQALNAIVFLYAQVLERELGSFGIIERAKRPDRLPVVLTRDEVKQILTALDGVPQLIGELLYGGGLRVMEAMRLRVKDVSGSFPRRG